VIGIVKDKNSATKWKSKVTQLRDESIKGVDALSLEKLVQLMAYEKLDVNSTIAPMLNSEDINQSKLVVDIQDIKSRSKLLAINKWSKEDIKVWVTQFRSRQVGKANIDDDLAKETIAVINRASRIQFGYELRDTQLIALWLNCSPNLNNSHGLLSQVSTGEGKTLITAGIAIFKALHGQFVDIVTSSTVRAISDYKDSKDFINLFDLTVTNNCDTACKEGEERDGGNFVAGDGVRMSRYEQNNLPVNIIYGDAGSFEADELTTESNPHDDDKKIICSARLKKKGGSSHAIIIDEVDSPLLDKASTVLYLSHDVASLSTAAMKNIFIEIWHAVNQPECALVQADNEKAIDDLADALKNSLKERGIIEAPENKEDYAALMQFIDLRMSNWVKSAISAKSHKVDDNYVIGIDKNGQTTSVIMDKDVGTEQSNSRWSNGLHQFIQIKQGQRLTPESLKAVFVSNTNFFKSYGNHIFGLTGTLGAKAEQDILKQIYGVGFCKIPRFKPSQYKQEKGLVLGNHQEWEDAIEAQVNVKISGDKKRAVLIICENVEKAKILHTRLQIKYPNAKRYATSDDPDIHDAQPGDVIVATNRAGRGTDLKTNDKLENNGGLHVILSYVPDNIRVEFQAFGRTARKGLKGSGQFIVLDPSQRSIEQLKTIRDQFEHARLSEFVRLQLPRIEMEEILLRGVDPANNEGGLGCEGFLPLYDRIESNLKKQNWDETYLQAQLLSLKNRWAFWLDSLDSEINQVHLTGRGAILEKFNAFQAEVDSLNRLGDNNYFRFLTEPSEILKLGVNNLKNEQWSKATKCFEKIKDSAGYEIANYFLSASQLNADYKGGIEVKRNFKEKLATSRKAIQKTMENLGNSAATLSMITERIRKGGKGASENQTIKQLQEQLSVWNIFSNSIASAIDSTLHPEQFKSSKWAPTTEQVQGLFSTLIKENVLKDQRLSKRIVIEGEEGKLRLLVESKDKKSKESVELPPLLAGYEQDFLARLAKVYQKRVLTLPNLIRNLDGDDGQSLYAEFADMPWPTKAQVTKHLLDKGLVVEKELDVPELRLPETGSQEEENSTKSKKEKGYVFNLEKILKNPPNIKPFTNLDGLRAQFISELDNDERSKDILARILPLAIAPVYTNDEVTSFTTMPIAEAVFPYENVESQVAASVLEALRADGVLKDWGLNMPGYVDKEAIDKWKANTKTAIKEVIRQEKDEKKKWNVNNDKDLDGATDLVFSIIENTLSKLKALPNSATAAKLVELNRSYFQSMEMPEPEGFKDFMRLALDTIIELEEKKDPPKWYEIAAVIVIGLAQIAAGLACKYLLPVGGAVVGEFLISMGCDDVVFGIQSAVSGEFSWEAYGKHKAESAAQAAIIAVTLGTVSFVKHLKHTKNFKNAAKLATGSQKAFLMQKGVTGAQIAARVIKEGASRIAITAVGEMASMGVNKLMDATTNNYSQDIESMIAENIDKRWPEISKKIHTIVMSLGGPDNDVSSRVLDEAFNRITSNIPSERVARSVTGYAAPILSGLSTAVAGKGFGKALARGLSSSAGTLANLGINIAELAKLTDAWMDQLTNELSDVQRKTTKNHEASSAQNNKEDTSSRLNSLSDRYKSQFQKAIVKTFTGRLSNTLSSVAMTGINKGISSGLGKLTADPSYVEEAAQAFQDSGERLKEKRNARLQDMVLGRRANAKKIDQSNLSKAEQKFLDNSKTQVINPETGESLSVAKLREMHGNEKLGLYHNPKTGEIIVKRPGWNDYVKSVANDNKPAGELERQAAADAIKKPVTVINGNEKKTYYPKDKNVRNLTPIEITYQPGLDGQAGHYPNAAQTAAGNNDCFYNALQDKLDKLPDNQKFTDVRSLRLETSKAMKKNSQLKKDYGGFAVDRGRYAYATYLYSLGGVINREGVTIPNGFNKPEELYNFERTLRKQLKKAGYQNAKIIIQGSAITGKKFTTKAPFDENRRSDFDVAIVNNVLVDRAATLGYKLRSNDTRTEPLEGKRLWKLKLGYASNDLRTQTNRVVNFMAFRIGAPHLSRPGMTLPNAGDDFNSFKAQLPKADAYDHSYYYEPPTTTQPISPNQAPSTGSRLSTSTPIAANQGQSSNTKSWAQVARGSS